MASKHLNYPTDWVYQWGLHDCVSLVVDLCGHLGLQVPTGYAAWHGLPEGKATVLALRKWGSMAAGHQAILMETGQWAPGAYQYPAVVSYRGRVCCEDGTVYLPPRPGCEFTGVVGEDGRVWAWTPLGLSPVSDFDGFAAITVPVRPGEGVDAVSVGQGPKPPDPRQTSVLGEIWGSG